MSNLINLRVASAFQGLALGDALSWSNQFSRAQNMPKWLERIRHEIEADMPRHNSTSLPKPFSLNQSPDYLIPGPGDATEWATWTATLLLKNQGNLNHAILDEAWRDLAASPADIHGRISVQAALKNFREGLTAPQSGRFNPHYFDDAALPRAVIIGITHPGDPGTAKAMAELDASFTQFEDGIWSAAAVATLFSRACNGGTWPELIQSTINELPENSLVKTTVDKAITGLDPVNSDVIDTAFFLNTKICNQIYSYGNIAHEILASLLVILQTMQGDREKMLACAALLPSAGSTLLALSSALGAVIETKSSRKSGFDSQKLILSGSSLPGLKGIHIDDIANQLGEIGVPGTSFRTRGKLLL